jgi:hypothetical protein
MFKRVLSDSAVCQRCRLRLLQQDTRPRCFYSRQQNDRSLKVEEEDDLDRPFWEKYDKKPSKAGDGARRVSERISGTRRLNLIGGVKRRIFAGDSRILTEATERLETQMLGRPAHAIVMREGLYKKKRPFDKEPDEEAETADIEALLQNQVEAPTVDEIRSNIAELRPADEFLTEKKFRELQKDISDSFLAQQLRDYIDHFPGDTSNEFLREAELDNLTLEVALRQDGISYYEWIKDISTWMPVHSQVPMDGRPRNPIYDGYLRDSASLKEKLTMQILRECWRLSIQEYASGLGEINIQLRDIEFMLLMRMFCPSHPLTRAGGGRLIYMCRRYTTFP